MPEYRATLGFNAWLLRRHIFKARSDKKARATRPLLDQWATQVMLQTAHENGTDLSSTPNAFIVIDRLDAAGQFAKEIDNFNHSGSRTHSDQLYAFTMKIAHLTLFSESDAVTGRPQGNGSEAIQAEFRLADGARRNA